MWNKRRRLLSAARSRSDPASFAVDGPHGLGALAVLANSAYTVSPELAPVRPAYGEIRKMRYRAPGFGRSKCAAGLGATLVAVWFCLGGCANRSISFDSLRPLQPYDASRNTITDLSSGVPGGVSLPHRDLLRVDFTSATDLRNMVVRESNVLFVRSYFCDRGDALGTLGSSGVYVDRADAGRETLVNRFLFLIDVSRKADPGSTPPEAAFDLSVGARDVCFYVIAHGVNATYKSKIATIPKTSIEQVFIGWKLR
jgi:hypothetical protein